MADVGCPARRPGRRERGARRPGRRADDDRVACRDAGSRVGRSPTRSPISAGPTTSPPSPPPMPDAFSAAARGDARWPAASVDAIAAAAAAPPARRVAGVVARPPRTRLAAALLAVPPGTKLPWFGPPMSAASMATARLMETWAHGQDVADALGAQRQPTDRLRHVAHIGVRARDYAFHVNGLAAARRRVPRRARRPVRRALDLGSRRGGPAGQRTGPRLLPARHPTPPPRRPRRHRRRHRRRAVADDRPGLRRTAGRRSPSRSDHDDEPEPLRDRECVGVLRRSLRRVREMLDGGELDVLTGDYLAELTMLILGRDRAQRIPTARLRQDVPPPDGGMPRARRRPRRQDRHQRRRAQPGRPRRAASASSPPPLGVDVQRRPCRRRRPARPRRRARPRIAADRQRLPRRAGGSPPASTPAPTSSSPVGSPTPRSSSARRPRTSDGRRTDYDALAGATVAGHVLECSAQATGGNYSFFTELADLRHAGFPIAEVARRRLERDHQASRHRRRGDAARPSPRSCSTRSPAPRYAGPDVTTRFDTIELADDGPTGCASAGSAANRRRRR